MLKADMSSVDAGKVSGVRAMVCQYSPRYSSSFSGRMSMKDQTSGLSDMTPMSRADGFRILPGSTVSARTTSVPLSTSTVYLSCLDCTVTVMSTCFSEPEGRDRAVS